ncbi:MAG: hypothetical protein LBQ27_00555 [Clostridiales bacterium]|jgi:hypothetical protein|nr:hypothetical protein [Clostridiales bacterium]
MYTGLTGKITIAEKASGTYGTELTIGYISNWSVEDNSDIIEFSEFGGSSPAGAGYTVKRPGQQSWSASADGAVSFENGKNQSALFSAKNQRKEIKLRLYLSAADNTYFEGTGFIESLSADMSAEDKGNISISVSGNGKLSLYVNDALING